LRSLGGVVVGRKRRRGREGLEGDLEAVDHLAGAAGVDGILGEAVDDGGEGDEDGGAVLDGRDFHAGDLGVDEDAAVEAVGVLEVVVVAIIFTFECGRAATLAGWGLVEVAYVVAVEVFEWFGHGSPPGYRLCMIFQTNHLRPATCMILKTKVMAFQDIQNTGVVDSLELLGRHKPEAGGFCLDLSSIIRGVSRNEVDKWSQTPIMGAR
jgi:hypothetical protein